MSGARGKTNSLVKRFEAAVDIPAPDNPTPTSPTVRSRTASGPVRSIKKSTISKFEAPSESCDSESSSPPIPLEKPGKRESAVTRYRSSNDTSTASSRRANGGEETETPIQFESYLTSPKPSRKTKDSLKDYLTSPKPIRRNKEAVDYDTPKTSENILPSPRVSRRNKEAVDDDTTKTPKATESPLTSCRVSRRNKEAVDDDMSKTPKATESSLTNPRVSRRNKEAIDDDTAKTPKASKSILPSPIDSRRNKETVDDDTTKTPKATESSLTSSRVSRRNKEVVDDDTSKTPIATERSLTNPRVSRRNKEAVDDDTSKTPKATESSLTGPRVPRRNKEAFDNDTSKTPKATESSLTSPRVSRRNKGAVDDNTSTALKATESSLTSHRVSRRNKEAVDDDTSKTTQATESPMTSSRASRRNKEKVDDDTSKTPKDTEGSLTSPRASRRNKEKVDDDTSKTPKATVSSLTSPRISRRNKEAVDDDTTKTPKASESIRTTLRRKCMDETSATNDSISSRATRSSRISATEAPGDDEKPSRSLQRRHEPEKKEISLNGETDEQKQRSKDIEARIEKRLADIRARKQKKLLEESGASEATKTTQDKSSLNEENKEKGRSSVRSKDVKQDPPSDAKEKSEPTIKKAHPPPVAKRPSKPTSLVAVSVDVAEESVKTKQYLRSRSAMKALEYETTTDDEGSRLNVARVRTPIRKSPTRRSKALEIDETDNAYCETETDVETPSVVASVETETPANESESETDPFENVIFASPEKEHTQTASDLSEKEQQKNETRKEIVEEECLSPTVSSEQECMPCPSTTEDEQNPVDKKTVKKSPNKTPIIAKARKSDKEKDSSMDEAIKKKGTDILNNESLYKHAPPLEFNLDVSFGEEMSLEESILREVNAMFKGNNIFAPISSMLSSHHRKPDIETITEEPEEPKEKAEDLKKKKPSLPASPKDQNNNAVVKPIVAPVADPTTKNSTRKREAKSHTKISVNDMVGLIDGGKFELIVENNGDADNLRNSRRTYAVKEVVEKDETDANNNEDDVGVAEIVEEVIDESSWQTELECPPSPEEGRITDPDEYTDFIVEQKIVERQSRHLEECPPEFKRSLIRLKEEIDETPPHQDETEKKPKKKKFWFFRNSKSKSSKYQSAPPPSPLPQSRNADAYLNTELERALREFNRHLESELLHRSHESVSSVDSESTSAGSSVSQPANYRRYWTPQMSRKHLPHKHQPLRRELSETTLIELNNYFGLSPKMNRREQAKTLYSRSMSLSSMLNNYNRPSVYGSKDFQASADQLCYYIQQVKEREQLNHAKLNPKKSKSSWSFFRNKKQSNQTEV